MGASQTDSFLSLAKMVNGHPALRRSIMLTSLAVWALNGFPAPSMQDYVSLGACLAFVVLFSLEFFLWIESGQAAKRRRRNMQSVLDLLDRLSPEADAIAWTCFDQDHLVVSHYRRHDAAIRELVRARLAWIERDWATNEDVLRLDPRLQTALAQLQEDQTRAAISSPETAAIESQSGAGRR